MICIVFALNQVEKLKCKTRKKTYNVNILSSKEDFINVCVKIDVTKHFGN